MVAITYICLTAFMFAVALLVNKAEKRFPVFKAAMSVLFAWGIFLIMPEGLRGMILSGIFLLYIVFWGMTKGRDQL